MPCHEAEQAVAAYFHAVRAMNKRRHIPGSDRIAAALEKRARLERDAERYAWEVASEV